MKHAMFPEPLSCLQNDRLGSYSQWRFEVWKQRLQTSHKKEVKLIEVIKTMHNHFGPMLFIQLFSRLRRWRRGWRRRYCDSLPRSTCHHHWTNRFWGLGGKRWSQTLLSTQSARTAGLWYWSSSLYPAHIYRGRLSLWRCRWIRRTVCQYANNDAERPIDLWRFHIRSR